MGGEVRWNHDFTYILYIISRGAGVIRNVRKLYIFYYILHVGEGWKRDFTCFYLFINCILKDSILWDCTISLLLPVGGIWSLHCSPIELSLFIRLGCGAPLLVDRFYSSPSRLLKNSPGIKILSKPHIKTSRFYPPSPSWTILIPSPSWQILFFVSAP